MKKLVLLKEHNRRNIYTVRIFLSYYSNGTFRPDHISRLQSRRAEIFFLILHSIPKGSLYTRYYLSSCKIRSKDVNGLKKGGELCAPSIMPAFGDITGNHQGHSEIYKSFQGQLRKCGEYEKSSRSYCSDFRIESCDLKYMTFRL